MNQCSKSEVPYLAQSEAANFAFVRGDTMPVLPVTIKKLDGEAVIPAAVRCQMLGRLHGDRHDVPVTVEPSGRMVIGGMLSEQTADLKAQLYDYDVELESDSGKIVTFLKGEIKVIGDITQ